jgi:uncharacterized protein (DUF362 family)
MKSIVSIVKCEDYQSQRVFQAVRKACDLIGGISRVVRAGDKVLIKPCFLKASPPEEGVDTHPEVVRAVIRLVKEAGGKPIVGDSPIGFQNIDEVYETSGVRKVCSEEGAELVKFIESETVDGIPIAKHAKNADVIISVPKFKTHALTILTGSIKSVFGVVPGLSKVKCHELFPKAVDFSKVLVQIFSYAQPRLTIVDGITSMEGDGPTTGTLRDTQIILASTDSVAADAVLSKLMGIDPFRVLTTKYAHEMRLGTGRLDEIEIVGDDRGDPIKGFKLPTAKTFFDLPESFLKIIAPVLLNFKPVVKKGMCSFCQKCIAICPAGAISVKKGRIAIDHKKCKVCVCCCELCPSNAITIDKGIFGIAEKLKRTTEGFFKTR